MQLNYLYIDNYKNLKDFKWEISNDESYPIFCIIGQNGAGKSNLLEALVQIFNCLNYSQSVTPTFTFEIRYRIEYFNVIIKGKKNSKKDYQVFIDGEEISFDTIHDSSSKWIYPKHGEKPEGILPENVIVYYSGYSNRMRLYFTKVNSDYAKIFRQGKSTNLPPLLLIEPIHFKMILLALFSFDSTFEAIYKDFLLKYFNIESIESFSIHIKKHTNWIKDNRYKNYFDAKGVIKTFLITLDELQKSENENSVLSEVEKAPFKLLSKNNPFIVNKVVYFFRKHESLINLKKIFGFESDIFKVLNVLYQSGYLADISVNIKKIGITDTISFDDLSEGEQQLLAIKGCIELLWGKNNLFLWDEPDTYLNPRWQWNLIPDLEKQIGDKVEDQFILTTHSPVLLSTSKKGVFEMENGKLSSVSKTYGLTINDALTRQEIEIQVDDVKRLYNNYLTLVQKGEGNTVEALDLRRRLESLWGQNHPELIKANVYLKYYK
jgi:predicted ATPase